MSKLHIDTVNDMEKYFLTLRLQQLIAKFVQKNFFTRAKSRKRHLLKTSPLCFDLRGRKVQKIS